MKKHSRCVWLKGISRLIHQCVWGIFLICPRINSFQIPHYKSTLKLCSQSLLCVSSFSISLWWVSTNNAHWINVGNNITRWHVDMPQFWRKLTYIKMKWWFSRIRMSCGKHQQAQRVGKTICLARDGETGLSSAHSVAKDLKQCHQDNHGGQKADTGKLWECILDLHVRDQSHWVCFSLLLHLCACSVYCWCKRFKHF